MSKQPKPGRREGALYVLLDPSRMEFGVAPDEVFVEAEDCRGRRVGEEAVPCPKDGSRYRLLEFAPVETLDELHRLRKLVELARFDASELSRLVNAQGWSQGMWIRLQALCALLVAEPLEELPDELESLRAFKAAVLDVAAQSDGVAGYHHNGAVAAWHEVLGDELNAPEVEVVEANE